MSQTEMKSSSPTPIASSPDVINKMAIKTCHIIKRPDFDGYGFNLHSEKSKPGQFIGKVDANSPAEAAGLKEGDRIIEVNGVPINSETHKQVVQRIKAIACEVRLLLVDVDGKGDGPAFNGHQSNGQSMEVSKTEQIMPGASENINSITMVSTKRPSQESHRSSNASASSNGNKNYGADVTDKAVHSHEQHKPSDLMMMNNNNNHTNTNNNNNNNNNRSSSNSNSSISSNTNVPPPPSATMMTSPKKTTMNSSGSHAEPASTGSGSGNASGSGNGTIKAGSLQLPMTAAEMRAKLMMKKKYDPKNESVDLKKKYEIVQKL